MRVMVIQKSSGPKANRIGSQEYQEKRFHLLQKPRIFLELTNWCNFRCVYCVGRLEERQKGYMKAHYCPIKI